MMIKFIIVNSKYIFNEFVVKKNGNCLKKHDKNMSKKTKNIKNILFSTYFNNLIEIYKIIFLQLT